MAPAERTPGVIGRPLIRVDETTSTMDLAAALARHGATHGTAVLAGHQATGRGRSGRIWSAPPGSSLLLSFIADTTRDRASLGLFSLLLGLAVAETVDEFLDERTSIKWPNDVLVDGRKIAGILVVNKVIPGRPGSCLIAGIGLNVNIRHPALPEGATSIEERSGAAQRLDDVLAVLFENLTATVNLFEGNDVAELRERLDRRLACRGEPVQIVDGARVLEGILCGIAPDGALILDGANGERVSVVAGDVTRGPRQAG